MTGGKHRHLFVVHGHFYQPPRENPWLGIIERQSSAAPAHDWNERVYDECYRPNAHSRLLDRLGMIKGINNNYRSMSFNFGPTLFKWLEKTHPRLTRAIVEADRESAARLNGHGNAIAQVYSHIIMPLASARDKITQVRWGVSFFQRTFGRRPEGIWLAETAINRDTARCCIDEGIRFTVLSPNQAEAFRPIDGEHHWSLGPVNVRRPYRYFPDLSKRNAFLDIFFFDEALARETSFGGLLTSADGFAQRLHACYNHQSAEPEAVILATDGETFGHHKAFGDMCLAFLFTNTASSLDLTPVNFGYLLEQQPPRWEVRLKDADGEGTAWSCAHGTGRWSRDCGCSTGGKPSWNQAWRAPLRQALDMLHKEIDDAFEQRMKPWFADPWKARDAYEPVMDEPSWEKSREAFAAAGAPRELTRAQVMAIRRLLESQKYLLFSYTSCGWFFADIAGIETMQNMAYASRAMAMGLDPEHRRAVEERFVAVLQNARSNSKHQTGRSLYEKHISRWARHLEILVFAVVAQQTVMERDDRRIQQYGYLFHLESGMRQRSGATHYHIFKVKIENDVSGEAGRYLVLLSHNQGRGLAGWVVPVDESTRSTFNIRDVNAWYSHPCACKIEYAAMFEDSKQAMADYLMRQVAVNTTTRYAAWFSAHEKVFESLVGLSGVLPPSLSGPVAYVLNAQWDGVMARLEKRGQEEKAVSELLDIWQRAERFAVTIDFTHSRTMLQNALAARFAALSANLTVDACDRIRYLLNIVDRFKIPIEKHKFEDIFYPTFQGVVRDLYGRYIGDPHMDFEDKSVMLHVLSFARRMNFNTDAYPVAEKGLGQS